MANELTISAKLRYNPDSKETPKVDLQNITPTGAKFVDSRQSVGTSEEALQLGELAGTTLGYGLLKVVGTDPTHWVDVKTATGGVIFARVEWGKPLLLKFGSGVTAPFVIASAAAVPFHFFIHEA